MSEYYSIKVEKTTDNPHVFLNALLNAVTTNTFKRLQFTQSKHYHHIFLHANHHPFMQLQVRKNLTPYNIMILPVSSIIKDGAEAIGIMKKICDLAQAEQAADNG